MYKVHIKSAGADLTVAPGETILDVALNAGIPYPHGCRSGRCGGCKSRLSAGEVTLLKHTAFALTDEEKRHGLVLACRAQPSTDCTIAWLATDTANHPVVELVLEVASLADATHDIRIVSLARNGASFSYSPGQYAELTFPGCPTRSYSMASLQGAGSVEFHVRHMPGGQASTFAARQLKVGDLVHVRGPFGSAFLRTEHTGPILAVAGGSGLAPIVAIAEAAVKSGMRQPFCVYYGARAVRDLYGEESFRKLSALHPKLSFTPVLSADSGLTQYRMGLVTAAVAKDVAQLHGWKAYVAGPPAMVDAATILLKERGLRAEDLHADAFYTASEQTARAPKTKAMAYIGSTT